jgi:hypothetical protein
MNKDHGWTFIYAPTPDGKMGDLGKQGSLLQLADKVFFPETSGVIAVPGDMSSSLVVRLRLEVRDGRPACTSLTFEQPSPIDGPKGPEITARGIRSINVGELIEAAIEWQSVHATMVVNTTTAAFGADGYTVDDDGKFSFWTDDHEANAKSGSLDLRRQRSVTNDLLRRVAACYLTADEAPTEAVAEEFDTSHRNATRYVAMARERGFLPPYRRGGKSAEEVN